mmetsp:Transcript_5815/g.10493  ORF Transcript_5815/g.10493 Transcript_5815/m.10493 type:complete len:138 (+) Transcript_5815:321-734(+)
MDHPRRSVHFSQFSQLSVYDKKEDEIGHWHSSQDKRRFTRELMQDARRMGMILARYEPQEDEIYNCVGLENLLSFEKARRTMEYKARHAKMIINAQHICGPEKLSRISEQSSACSRLSAQKLAEGYWMLGTPEADRS